MHPLLAAKGRIILYLLVWAALGGLLGYLLTITGRLALAGSGPAGAFPWLCFTPSCAWRPGICAACCRWDEVRAPETVGQSHGGGGGGRAVLDCRWRRCWDWGSAVIIRRSTNASARSFRLLFGIGVLLYMLSVALHYVLLSVESSKESETREHEARTLGAGSRNKSAEGADQSAFSVQQPELHRRARHGGWDRGRATCASSCRISCATRSAWARSIAFRWATNWRWRRPIWQ